MTRKHRQQISEGQLAVLKLLYKYRYGSVELLRESLGLNPGPVIYKKLVILGDERYVARRYDSSYRIKGMPAAYYLLPKGYRELQKLPEFQSIDGKIIKSAYKDKTASLAFITRNLAIYSVSCQLQRLYPMLKFFTKRELTAYNYFPAQLPDGFVSLKAGDETKRYFVELFLGDVPTFAVEQHLRQLIEYFEEDEWAVTKAPFPSILFVCGNGNIEKRMCKQVIRALNRSSAEMQFYTTTLQAISGSSKSNDVIWSATDEPEELLALTELV